MQVSNLGEMIWKTFKMILIIIMIHLGLVIIMLYFGKIKQRLKIGKN